MPTSQNGWPAYDNGRHPELVAIPHVAGRVRRGDVAEILVYVIGRFDREVEPVAEAAGQPEDDWGWASRPVRGKTTDLSNHASGTAVDLNAPRHPMGRRGTFTTGQVAAIRSILAAVSPAVRWGGDYSGRADEMHFEINASAATVAAVAARLRGSHGGGAPAAPATPDTSEEDDMTPDERQMLTEVRDRLRTVDTNTTGIARQVWGYVNSSVNGKRDAYALLSEVFRQVAPISRSGVATEFRKELADIRPVLEKIAADTKETARQLLPIKRGDETAEFRQEVANTGTLVRKILDLIKPGGAA